MLWVVLWAPVVSSWGCRASASDYLGMLLWGPSSQHQNQRVLKGSGHTPDWSLLCSVWWVRRPNLATESRREVLSHVTARPSRARSSSGDFREGFWLFLGSWTALLMPFAKMSTSSTLRGLLLQLGPSPKRKAVSAGKIRPAQRQAKRASKSLADDEGFI